MQRRPQCQFMRVAVREAEAAEQLPARLALLVKVEISRAGTAEREAMGQGLLLPQQIIPVAGVAVEAGVHPRMPTQTVVTAVRFGIRSGLD